MNEHSLDAADDLITVDRPDPDSTFPPELTTGPEGFKKLFGMLIAAFPDLHFTNQFMVGERDMVGAFTTIEGRSAVRSWGCPPAEDRSRSTMPTTAASPMTG